METSYSSLIEMTCDTIQRAKNNDSNSLIHLDEEGAMERAKELDQNDKSGAERGRLYGRLIVVKDNIFVAGMPNSAGTPALRGFFPKEDNLAVASLKAQGAIILGKANMHELAFGITSDNAAFGPVRNPADPTKFAGGSSGGTAAAIAAGIVEAGLGTDTGGSVRIPASLTGICALRPSSGRYPNDKGVTPVSKTRDTIGPMARTVSDLMLLDSVIVGSTPEEVPERTLSSLRLGVDREYFWSNLDPQTKSVMDAAMERLEKAGVTLVEAPVPNLAELVQKSGFPIALFEANRDMRHHLATEVVGGVGSSILLEDVVAKVASPDVATVLSMATQPETAVPEEVYEQAMASCQTMQQVFEIYFRQHQVDALVFPTTTLPARDIEGSIETVELNGEQVPTFSTYIRNTEPASLAGLPGISLPVGKTTDGGLPVGLELDGPRGSDRSLLAIALEIESLFEDNV